MAHICRLRIRQRSLDRGDVQRRGHILDNRVQQLLNTLIAIGCSTEHRDDLYVAHASTQSLFQLVKGDLLPLQIEHHQLIIGLTDGFNHGIVVLFRHLLHILRNVRFCDIFAEVVIVNESLHGHQINDALKFVFLANRQLNRNRIGIQTVFHHLYGIVKVSSHDVHLIDEGHPGNVVLVSLAPHIFRLWLHAAFGTEDTHRSVQNAQGALYLNGKINVSRRINDIDAVFLPKTGGRSGRNGDTALLLLLHPVHLGGSFMGIADLMGLTGIEQNTFRQRGLTGVNVRHNPNITRVLERIFSRQCLFLLLNYQRK